MKMCEVRATPFHSGSCQGLRLQPGCSFSREKKKSTSGKVTSSDGSIKFLQTSKKSDRNNRWMGTIPKRVKRWCVPQQQNENVFPNSRLSHLFYTNSGTRHHEQHNEVSIFPLKQEDRWTQSSLHLRNGYGQWTPRVYPSEYLWRAIWQGWWDGS